MKKAKLLSLALAAVLLCGCIIGFLTVGASAETVTWTVDGTGADENCYATLQAALEAASAAEWASDAELVINITTTTAQTPARSEDGILFVPTIWRGNRDADKGDVEYGNKLPIAINGGTISLGTKAKLDMVFTNDYTFDDVTFGSAGTTAYARYYYAGSGNITIKNDKIGLWSYMYGDNCTLAAYAGWKEGDIEAIKKANDGLIPSSMTLVNVTQINASKKNTSFANHCASAYAGTEDAFQAATAATVEVEVKPSDCKVSYASDENCKFGWYVDANGTFSSTATSYYEAGQVVYGAKSNPHFGKVVVTVKNPHRVFYGNAKNLASSGDMEFNLYVDAADYYESFDNLSYAFYGGTLSGTIEINLYNGTILPPKGLATTIAAGSEVKINYHSGTYDTLNALSLANTKAYFKGNATITLKDGVKVTTAYDTWGGNGDYSEGTYTNVIENGAQVKAFNGKGGVSVTNEIYGKVTGQFRGSTSAVTGDVTNNFYKGCSMAAIQGAYSTVGGTVISVFNGGTFNGTIQSGNYLNSTSKVVNKIYGGTFNSAFYASGTLQTTSAKELSTETYPANVENYITAGTFKSTFACGTCRGYAQNVKTYISGGTFEKEFYGGNAGHEAVPGRVENSTVYIFGGSFKRIGLHKNADVELEHGAIVYNIYRNETDLPENALAIAQEMFGETKEVEGETVAVVATDLLKELKFDGALTRGEQDGDAVNFYGGDENYIVSLSSSASLDLTDVVKGDIYTEKTGNWYRDNVYIKTFKDVKVHIDLTYRNIYGLGEIITDDTYQYIKTNALSPESVQLELKDKINIVIYYNAAEVEAYWPNMAHNYNVIETSLGTLDCNTFSEDNKVELEGVAYYKFVITGISPRDLNKEFTVDNERNYVGTTSLAKILENSIALGTSMNNAKGEALIALCDTIKALGTDELGSYKVQNVVRNYDLIVNNEESFSFEGVGVVMKDAIGMSIYYDEAEDLFAGNYTVKVGNNPITVTPDTATFGEGENAKTYGCIDIFVNVADAQKNITVEICDAEGNTVFKVATTVEFLASAYDNNVDAANMLAYIQAANAYHKLPQAA